MKLKNLIRLYEELKSSKGVLSCKLPLSLKSELIDLYDELEKKINLFDKEQISLIKELGIKLDANSNFDINTPQDLISKFSEERLKIMEDNIPFDFSKYIIDKEKLKNLEIEDTPYVFIKIFLKEDFTDL